MWSPYGIYFTNVSVTLDNSILKIMFFFRNTPYSEKKIRIIYLFFCKNIECNETWKALRFSTESKYYISSSNSRCEESLVLSDDWLLSAGIEIHNCKNSSEKRIESKIKIIENNIVNTSKSYYYLMKHIFESSLKSNEDRIQTLLEKYLIDQEDKSSECLELENTISSEISSENTNVEYIDPLLADENMYVHEKDRYIHDFIQEISRFPRQVVRYCFDGNPIFTESLKNTRIQNCYSCGSKKVFEFQVLSTIIHEWKDAFGESDFFSKGKSEWSTVIVYTCFDDCNAELQEESVIVQYMN